MYNNIKKHCMLKLVKDEYVKNKIVKIYYTLKFIKDRIVKKYIDADNTLIKIK